MKKLTLIGGLALCLGTQVVGCKSAPQLAWWKKPAGVEATAVAHAAPEDPAEAAKLAATAPATGGVATPFTPQATVSAAPPAPETAAPAQVAASAPAPSAAYPTTPYPTASYTATPYPTTTAAPVTAESAVSAVASAARDSVSQQTSANLGAVAMPYDPQNVPGGAALAAAAPAYDRYGQAMAAVAAASPAAGSMAANSATPAATPPGADRYAATPVAADRYAVPGLPPIANSALSSAADSANTAVNRYGLPSPQAVTPVAGEASTAPTVAAASYSGGYRPGGTSSYPGTQVATAPASEEKVASRTESSVSPYEATPPAEGAPTNTTPVPTVEPAPTYRY